MIPVEIISVVALLVAAACFYLGYRYGVKVQSAIAKAESVIKKL